MHHGNRVAKDLQRVIDGWQEKLAQALEKGHAGMRVNGYEAWLTDKDWKDLAASENKLNELIASKRMIVLCTCPRVTPRPRQTGRK